MILMLSDIKERIDAEAVGKAFIETCWDSEPSKLKMNSEVLPDNMVSLHILTDPFYFCDPEDVRVWQITMPYQDFYDAIVSAATRQLIRQGIVGISKSWLSEDNPIFPVRNILRSWVVKPHLTIKNHFAFHQTFLKNWR